MYAPDSDCYWNTVNPCFFDDFFTGDFDELEGHTGWFTGRSIEEGAELYLSCPKPDPSETPWWKTEPPQGLNGKPGPFLTTCIQRAKAGLPVVLKYTVAFEYAFLFTGKQGGFEVQEEVFNLGYDAYYSCKECEVSFVNDIADSLLNWQQVVVIQDGNS